MNTHFFELQLKGLINEHCAENSSDTPDHILARFLMDCLTAWNAGVQQREHWLGRSLLGEPANVGTLIQEGVDLMKDEPETSEDVERRRMSPEEIAAVDLRGAMARGYCTAENAHKVLDPDLIEAMAIEVEKLAS